MVHNPSIMPVLPTTFLQTVASATNSMPAPKAASASVIIVQLKRPK
jgi:hypothetical protein